MVECSLCAKIQGCWGLSSSRLGKASARCCLVSHAAIVRQIPIASMGQLLASGTSTFRTIAPTASAHAVALMTFAQVAVTAAVAYGACVLPQTGGDPLQEKLDKQPQYVLDGVDVSEYKILSHPEVQRAIEYAREAHAGQLRLTGDPYITHCLHTAKILAALVPQEGKKAVETIVAGILHDVVDDTPRTLKDLQEEFGADVADLVAGVSRLSYINQLLRRHRRLTAHEREPTGNGLTPSEVDSLRIMLLGMVKDPRVVLVKLADRLHNMRTIYPLPLAKARAVAQETLAVWCSLASRLGVWAVKAELEDLCFAVLQPETFRELRSGLAEMWSPNENLKHLRKITKREKRRALIFGSEGESNELNSDEREELTIKDLLEAVVPFNLLLDRRERSYFCGLSGSRSKVVQDAEIALAALSLCEEALDRELAISTSYIPGTEVSLSGRLKSLYSTHSKMTRKGVELDQIYDARALRVVVGDAGGELYLAAVKGCYSLLDIVHRLWLPIGGEFDDYILNPKPSGYQSLHTAVRGPDGAPLEVQIRTQVMHEHAECGNAAHWLYKESGAPTRTPDVPKTTSLHTSNAEERKAASVPNDKKVLLDRPALRIEGGILRAAVIARADDDGKGLLVAVSSEEVGIPFYGNNRWRVFAYMRNKVAKSWWFAPGHGDWDTHLEKYVLCSDGIYHKQDQFERPLPVFLQLLDLSDQEQQEYEEVMALLEEGIDLETQRRPEISLKDDVPATTTTRLNNKVKLLRSMLQWEKEVHFEAARHPDDPRSAVLTEVLVICWPNGDIMRMPAGSTVSDASQRMGIDNTLVLLNNQVADPLVELKDGDVIEFRE